MTDPEKVTVELTYAQIKFLATITALEIKTQKWKEDKTFANQMTEIVKVLTNAYAKGAK